MHLLVQARLVLREIVQYPHEIRPLNYRDQALRPAVAPHGARPLGALVQHCALAEASSRLFQEPHSLVRSAQEEVQLPGDQDARVKRLRAALHNQFLGLAHVQPHALDDPVHELDTVPAEETLPRRVPDERPHDVQQVLERQSPHVHNFRKERFLQLRKVCFAELVKDQVVAVVRVVVFVVVRLYVRFLQGFPVEFVLVLCVRRRPPHLEKVMRAEAHRDQRPRETTRPCAANDDLVAAACGRKHELEHARIHDNESALGAAMLKNHGRVVFSQRGVAPEELGEGHLQPYRQGAQGLSPGDRRERGPAPAGPLGVDDGPALFARLLRVLRRAGEEGELTFRLIDGHLLEHAFRHTPAQHLPRGDQPPLGVSANSQPLYRARPKPWGSCRHRGRVVAGGVDAFCRRPSDRVVHRFAGLAGVLLDKSKIGGGLPAGLLSLRFRNDGHPPGRPSRHHRMPLRRLASGSRHVVFGKARRGV
mmetsp:Transcript_17702/g.52803  ORF Transcript_17702/g.52803 Transcript_17702/m.52803 type:complete len:477 (+) Transcript_17702:566-1996(+)